jgi:hypothetical protein
MSTKLYLVEVFCDGVWKAGPRLYGCDPENATVGSYAVSSLELALEHREAALGYCQLPVRISEYLRTGTVRHWPAQASGESVTEIEAVDVQHR